MKRILSMLLAAVSLTCLLLTGCGGPAGSSDVSDEPTESSTTTTTASSTTTTTATTDTTADTSATTSATTAKPTTTVKPTTTAKPTTSTTTSTSTTKATTTTVAPGEEATEIGAWYSTWYSYQIPGSNNNQFDTWNAWDLNFKPLSPDGTFQYHDSMDEKTIQFHLEKMSEAQIDFIIMDQTNNIDVDNGYINKRSLAVAKHIKKYNDSGARPVRYCSAIGGIQWRVNDASIPYDQRGAIIEEEASKLYHRYVTQDFGSEKYHYYYKGKPVLVIYGDGAKDAWNNYSGDKTYANKFTIRWADNKSTPGYWGWAYNAGPKWHPETTVIMPGWHNRAGHAPVPRDYGNTYRKFLDTVLEANYRPRIIVINSFNEYAERTSVFPAVANAATEEGDRWYTSPGGKEDPYMYWEMTLDFIKKFKALDKPLANF